MNQDFYEILQVHPRAEQDMIEAAYERLRAMYDPARLDGAADELVQLARTKRDAIEQAHSILADPQRRARYDAELAARQPVAVAAPAGFEDAEAADEPVLDYRPLPPARRAERPRGFDAQPVRRNVARPAAAGRKVADRPPWASLVPMLLATMVVLVIGAALYITGGLGNAPQAAVAPTAPVALADQMATAVAGTRAETEQNPNDPAAWVNYGNALYDSVTLVRENLPDSPMYQRLLPRYLQASEAYSQAIELGVRDPLVRSDLGASQCYYGAGTGDQDIVRQGVEQARQAETDAPTDARVLLNLGNCLVNTVPPQPQEAIAVWRRVTQSAPADSNEAIQAQQLIARYE